MMGYREVRSNLLSCKCSADALMFCVCTISCVFFSPIEMRARVVNHVSLASTSRVLDVVKVGRLVPAAPPHAVALVQGSTAPVSQKPTLTLAAIEEQRPTVNEDRGKP